MKTIIFYRSSYQGNTLKIARAIADGLSAELVSIDNNPQTDLGPYDLIGFGSGINFAMHDIRLLRFVEKLNLIGKRTFIFSTRCRPFLGSYHRKLEQAIARSGGEVVDGFSCRGFDRTGPWIAINGYNKGKPDDKDIFNARLFARNLKRRMNPIAKIRQFPITDIVNDVPLRMLENGDVVAGDKVVFLNTSSCVKCMKCVRGCPMHILSVVDDSILPKEDRDCIQCHLCSDNCPTSSIYVRATFLNGLRIALTESFSTRLQTRYYGNE